MSKEPQAMFQPQCLLSLSAPHTISARKQLTTAAAFKKKGGGEERNDQMSRNNKHLKHCASEKEKHVLSTVSEYLAGSQEMKKWRAPSQQGEGRTVHRNNKINGGQEYTYTRRSQPP